MPAGLALNSFLCCGIAVSGFLALVFSQVILPLAYSYTNLTAHGDSPSGSCRLTVAVADAARGRAAPVLVQQIRMRPLFFCDHLVILPDNKTAIENHDRVMRTK